MYETVKLLFAGGRELGTNVLEWLCNQDYIEIVGVCPLPEGFDGDNYQRIRDIIERYHLPIVEMSDVVNLVFDIGLSVNYNRIISADVLNVPSKGFFNVHHSYNLRLKGRNITTHAILNSRKENVFYHGTTLHKMVPQLDAGPIVASKACEILHDDTAFSLSQKVDMLALELVKEWIPRIAHQAVFMYEPPREGIHEYRNKDLPEKEIHLDELESDDIYDLVRAFDYGEYEPAYFFDKNGTKICLVAQRRDEYIRGIEVKGKVYYTK